MHFSPELADGHAVMSMIRNRWLAIIISNCQTSRSVLAKGLESTRSRTGNLGASDGQKHHDRIIVTVSSVHKSVVHLGWDLLRKVLGCLSKNGHVLVLKISQCHSN